MPDTATLDVFEDRLPLVISSGAGCKPIKTAKGIIEMNKDGGCIDHPQLLEAIYDFSEMVNKDEPFVLEDLYAYLCEIFGVGPLSAMRFVTQLILENTIDDQFFYFFEWEFSDAVERYIYWSIS